MSAPGCASSARTRWCRCCSTRTATTRGTPTGWSGLCSVSSTTPSTSRGAPPSPPTSVTGSTETRASCVAAAATPSRAGWPGCWRRTPCSGRRWSPTGAPAATPTARADRSTATWPGSPSCGAGWSRASARRAPDVRHTETLARLRAGGDGLDLPPRLSLFGHTRLPVTEVELLGALGELREVHLWLPQVSDGAVGGAGGRGRPRGRCRASEDASIRRVGHPLLGSLGRDARELQRTLARRGCRGRMPVVSRRHLSQPRVAPSTTGGVAAGLVAGRPAGQRRARPGHPGGAGARLVRPVGAGARVPRCGPPGRRPPRGAGRAAGGRSDPGAARHPGDVS